jgi:hypothetical protein
MHVTRRAFAGIVAAAALALVLVPTASAASASGPATYADPAGDAKSAPDVTKVTVDLDAASGAVRFDIELAAGEQLANRGGVFIALDADRNRATGDQLGSDYVVAVFDDVFGMLKWNGSEMVLWSQHQPLVVTRAPGRVTVTFCSCDIGAQAFNFVVVGARGTDVDVAPDTGGTYPAPQTTVTIQSFLYQPQPFVPRAGKRFTVKPLGVRLSSNEVVAPDSLQCSAKLAGKTLRGSGAGGCSWLLPKKSRGKSLTVTVIVSYQGQSETFSKTFKVT